MYQRIYEEVGDIKACFRLLDATRQIGCSGKSQIRCYFVCKCFMLLFIIGLARVWLILEIGNCVGVLPCSGNPELIIFLVFQSNYYF